MKVITNKSKFKLAIEIAEVSPEKGEVSKPEK